MHFFAPEILPEATKNRFKKMKVKAQYGEQKAIFQEILIYQWYVLLIPCTTHLRS